jgi:hypothetical protein
MSETKVEYTITMCQRRLGAPKDLRFTPEQIIKIQFDAADEPFVKQMMRRQGEGGDRTFDVTNRREY